MTHTRAEDEIDAAAGDAAPVPINEVRGLGMLISTLTDRLVSPVEGMHRAIAGRAFRLAGSAADPVRKVHDGLTGVAYQSIRLAGSVLGLGVAAGGIAAARGREFRPLSRSERGAGFIAAVNGILGDRLEEEGNHLGVEMSLRDADGAVIEVGRDTLRGTFPAATPRIVVMVHGLVETEHCWRGRRRDEMADAPGLGDVLSGDLGFTPLVVRYNTGRRVSRNGEDLARLLDQIVAEWPVPVEAIVLVGHSMGGLVARGAARVGRDEGQGWVDMLRHIVTLGTPHLGSSVEKVANVVARGLRIAPESRPLGEFIDARSVGIKDLRFGAVVDDDWTDVDPDALLVDTVGDASPVEGVGYHFVASAITDDPGHPMGVLIGDWLVRVPSGTGAGKRRTVQATNVRVLGGRNHFDLLTDPVVHEQIRVWLAG